MRRAGIREVRQNFSLLLEEVRKGEEIVITDRGRPVATLRRYDPSRQGKPLPDRRKKIRKRSKVTVDSAVYLSELRDRA
jgi:prevent-host-death family protein